MLGSNILQSLNGSANAVWVSHVLGEAALTATSNANQILFLMLGAVFGVSMAANIMIGQAIGAARRGAGQAGGRHRDHLLHRRCRCRSASLGGTLTPHILTPWARPPRPRPTRSPICG